MWHIPTCSCIYATSAATLVHVRPVRSRDASYNWANAFSLSLSAAFSYKEQISRNTVRGAARRRERWRAVVFHCIPYSTDRGTRTVGRDAGRHKMAVVPAEGENFVPPIYPYIS